MQLDESIFIRNVTADEVWPYLADPVLQADWNPKIISIDRQRTGPVIRGERFEMIYRQSKESLSRVEATVVEPGRRVEFTHRVMWKKFEQLATESYELVPRDDGVTVKETIGLVRSGIPWYWLTLIWLIKTFGKPTGKGPLDRLKTLIESPKGACPNCGYDLRGTPNRCPECGTAIDRPAASI